METLASEGLNPTKGVAQIAENGPVTIWRAAEASIGESLGRTDSTFQEAD